MITLLVFSTEYTSHFWCDNQIIGI